MVNLSLKIFTLGELYTNCYIVYDSEQKRGFIIDAPSPSGEVLGFINKEKLNIEFIALTHGHFDHISALSEMPFPFYVHKEDVQLLKNPDLNGSIIFNLSIKTEKEPILLLEENKPLIFGDSKIEVIHTPGHTPGGVCMKIGNWLFSGDSLFFGTIGRTDVPLGSYTSLIKALKEKILVLPKDTIIYPGHGESSTIGEEVVSNPFLK
ncbi:MAG: MBL fold metallo-hydrolase [Candidatus Omnitrophica bacterium]|jgi:glyoxylase-like metal-dependent hydrolase (beta-lactamase superfamily II)|nr:MBL fold metallo-hydrolase [Candidatus Omnitrophota bacterium]